MNFLTVSPRLGTLIEPLGSEASTLPEFFYVNFKVKTEPFTIWWMQGGERITHTIAPEFTPITAAGVMVERSDFLFSRWPELYFVWYAYAVGDVSPRMRITNVQAQTTESFGGANAALSPPIAHPNGKVYWTVRHPTNDLRDVMVWDPPASPAVLATLNTLSETFAFHRTAAGDDVMIHHNTSAPLSSFVVDLATGSTSQTPTFSTVVRHGIYSFADPSVDQLPGPFGGAYGRAVSFSGLRGSYEDDSLGYGFGLGRHSSGAATSAIYQDSNSTLRWNASRKAIACYPFGAPNSSNLKWFDVSQPYDAAINSDDSFFVEAAPLLDPDDPDSYPDMVYPAGIEPF